MKKHWVEKIFEECGAILEGHFILTSKKHSGRYLDKTMIYPDGEKVSYICSVLANEIAGVFPEWTHRRIEVVVGPAEGGIILAHEVAKCLSETYQRKVLSVFTEKKGKKQVLKRTGFRKIVAGSLVLIVDDILTTGGSIRGVIREVQEAGGHVIAVAVICNRGGVKSADIMDYPLFSLWEIIIESQEPEQCSLCQKGILITNTK